VKFAKSNNVSNKEMAGDCRSDNFIRNNVPVFVMVSNNGSRNKLPPKRGLLQISHLTEF
jgi:hypothetical protein